jgi:signal transduction histidine kinase
VSPLLRALARAGSQDTEEEIFRSQTLHRVVWTTFCVASFFLALLILEQPSTLARRVETIVWLAGMSCIPLVLNRFGWTRLGGSLFVGSLIYLVSTGAWLTGGVSSPQMNSFVLFVLMAGVLLGTVGGLIAGGICIAIGFFLVWAEAQGTLPAAVLEFTPLSNWLYGGIWITLAALLQHQVAGALRFALGRATIELEERRRSQGALEDAQDRLRELAASLQIAREEERRSLAMDIHDEIGGGLAGVSLALHRVKRDAGGGAPLAQERLERLCGDLDRVGESVRRLAREMRPATLDEFGLVEAIRSLVEDVRERTSAQIELRVTTSGTVGLPPEDGIHVYRIVQEAMTNAVKHSDSPTIALTLSNSDASFEIVVEDAGRGLPPSFASSRSLGIANMYHRAQLVGGSLELAGTRVGGTRVFLRVPNRRASIS